MHFRHLIITGFIAGAAILFPTLSFAEKGPDAGKPETQKAAVQDILPAKAENATASGKAASEPAVKNLAKEKPAQVKPVTIPLQSAKSKGKVQSSVKKNANATKAPLPKAANEKKSGVANKLAKPSNQKAKKAGVKSTHNNSEYVKVTKNVSPGLRDKVETYQEPAEKPVSKKKPATKVIVQKPETKEDAQDSSHKERYPKGDNLPNPPSRSKASVGPSSDRTSNGNTSTGFSDKWFVWDQYIDLITSKPFTSRVIVYRSQWVNAPPSPPPVEAPIFIPYTDAIRHG